MDLQAKVDLFKEELELIADINIREFTKECIRMSPDYVFEDCPSSTSGKYHPVEELGPDGTILHTKKVFALAYELSRALDCENHRDEICAAALLHDMMKQGHERVGHTVKEHPQLMAKLVASVYNDGFKDKLNTNSMMIIYKGVYYHYGPWTEQSVRKPITSYAPEELAVYLADYVSSKRFVSIDAERKLRGEG